MSTSLIETLNGNAALPDLLNIVNPTVLTSDTGTVSVLEGADTKDTISPNTLCKYINIRFQTAPQDTNTHGFYEYAIVLATEQNTNPSTAPYSGVNLNTLGDIAINLNRGKCIWNGCVPINQDQAQVLDLNLKIPSKWCKWQRGQFLSIFHYYRPSDIMDTAALKVILSTQWKAYL